MGFFKSFSKSASSSTVGRIYLDFASSTPLDRDMLATFPKLSEMALQANPSALHKEGQLAKKALTEARELVATTIFVHKDEIIFTANATESDNLAIHGFVNACIANNKKGREVFPHDAAFREVSPRDTSTIAIITTDAEHAAVLETTRMLAEKVTTIILQTENGLLDPKSIIIPEGITHMLVSVMYVNNEIGVVQPVYEIAKRVRFLRKHHPAVTIALHIDATQAPLHFSLNTQKLGIDMMTLGATKLYCPKGVGMLYVRRGTAIAPIVYGGGQEYGLRPGTEPVQLIHDFAHALSFAQKNVDTYTSDILSLQTAYESLIKKEIPSAVITGEGIERTPHISHIALKGFDSELLVLELDARGIAVSAKSACKNDASSVASAKLEEVNESDIVTRIYGEGWGAVRLSFGRTTTKTDVQKAVKALVSILNKYNK